MLQASMKGQVRAWGAALLASALLGACGGGGGGAVPPACLAGASLVNGVCQADQPSGPAVQAWVTSADQTKLLARQPDMVFGDSAAAASNIDVDANTRYQAMVGFGAALTDASAWLIQNRMNSAQRTALMQDLFGRGSGIGLSFTRLTIGASDFSRTHYSLDDRPPGQTDPTLAYFSFDVQPADVLPVVQSAKLINPQLSVMASPWSAPGWMKSSDSLIQGRLLPQYYGVYAEYLRRYLDAWEARGVPIFALTAQNEPHFEPANYPGMRLDDAARASFIGQHLGPLLARRATAVRILDWDHNWDEPNAPLTVLADPLARPYVAGVAWHCYAGDVSAQTQVHNAYPDKETYFTECSGGAWAPQWSDNLLWNVRTLVIGATRGWARGVLLWNLALDENHGPHLGGCSDCRGVVTINSATGEVTRNAEYYALAHASRFVRPGAQRIDSSSGVNGLDSVAFRNADDGSLALLVANSAADTRSFSVRQAGQSFSYALPAGSVATFVWTPRT